MRLVRYGRPGKEKPGLIDDEGKLRDLSGVIDDIGPEQLSDKALRKLGKVAHDTLPLVRGNPRFGVPLARVGKFIGIGVNYADHAAESGKPIPTEPIVFMKAISCLSGPDDDVMLPKGSKKTDWEVELGVVIGSVTRYVEESEALNYVAGYVVVNDISEREFQIERGGQWTKGKSCDTFNPIGPYLCTTDALPDVSDLSLEAWVNGAERQHGSTKTMVFDVDFLVHYISQFMTLEAGDLISTGTPPGVGLGRKPPTYLRAGDVV